MSKAFKCGVGKLHCSEKDACGWPLSNDLSKLFTFFITIYCRYIYMYDNSFQFDSWTCESYTPAKVSISVCNLYIFYFITLAFWASNWRMAPDCITPNGRASMDILLGLYYC